MKTPIDLLAPLGIPSLPSYSHESIAALMWARELLQQHQSRVYGVNTSEGIEELRPVSIGGVDQYIHIRGRNKNNPILLYLHGGPGNAMIGYMDAIQRPWEDYFTVIHWDQRQRGKSYYPENDNEKPLTVDQFILDAEELIQYLMDYLQKEKIFLIGHSWGSVLGAHVAQRHPDWLHAYIGIGQVVNSSKSEKVIYERLLAHAKEKNEHALTAKLEAITPFLDAQSLEREKSFAENCVFVRRELSRLAGETSMHNTLLDDTAKIFNFEKVISPHVTLTDLKNSILAEEFAVLRSPYTFTKDYLSINLPIDVGNSFETPIFFFTGCHDWQTPKVLSDEWFNQIDAPHKELLHFEESCHYIINEEPGKFLTSLVNKVLPCAQN